MSDYLIHHGIQGQKWGVRRYQNEDGSLTSAGKRRYGYGDPSKVSNSKFARGVTRMLNDQEKALRRASVEEHENLNRAAKYGKKADKAYTKALDKVENKNRYSRNMNKYNKLVEKEHEYAEKAKANRKFIEDGEKFCYKAAGMLAETGNFSVSMKVETYKANKYMNAGKRFLYGTLGLSETGTGIKYKVKFAPQAPKEQQKEG